jgi:predicted DNA-binding transcriptional regulator AlpA
VIAADLIPELAALIDEVGSVPPTLTAPQVAELFGVGVDHVYAEVRAGEWPTPCLRIGRAVRFPTVPALEALGLWPLQPARSPHPAEAPARPFLAVVST